MTMSKKTTIRKMAEYSSQFGLLHGSGFVIFVIVSVIVFVTVPVPVPVIVSVSMTAA